jgi:hypothetical protein
MMNDDDPCYQQYRCRNCGEVFVNGHQSFSFDFARSEALAVIMQPHYKIDMETEGRVATHARHACSGSEIGIADLIGLTIKPS